MSEHTLTPWINDKGTILDGTRRRLADVMSTLWIPCDEDSYDCREFVDEANAEFIVRACNNYDSLLEALKRIGDLRKEIIGSPENAPFLNEIDDLVGEAIAEAEE